MLDKILLFPYWAVLKIRHALYDGGARKVNKAEVPTISVGNITAGGTGKTPHVEMILRLLQQSDAWGASQLAVLSRGYKRSSSGFQQVLREGSASRYGDEPLQIKKKFPAVTVAVCKNRVQACGYLCHPESIPDKKKINLGRSANFPSSDLIILDDGLQYRKLKPSLNVILVDYNRPLNEDHLLPIGRLRDLPERIHTADVVIVSKCPSYLDNWERTSYVQTLGIKDYSSSDNTGAVKGGRRIPVLFTTIKYSQCMPMFENSDMRYAYAKNLILFTGIAQDKPLLSYLSDSYSIVEHLVFPDHHKFTSADLSKIASLVRKYPTATCVTTEKDAQRVLDCTNVPQNIRDRLLYVPIEVDFLTDEERTLFVSELTKLKFNNQ